MNEHRRFDEDDARIDPAPQAVPEMPEPAKVAPVAAAAPAVAAPARRSLSGRLLTALVLLILGAAAALIGGPRLAPMLPAPVAAWLAPAQQGGGVDAAALARVEQALAEAVASARAEAEAARAEAARALAVAEDAVAAAAATGPAPAAPAAPDADTVARIAALEAALAALGETVEAESAADDVASAAALDAIEDDIAALDRRLAEAPAFTAPADLADLRTRLAALEAALASDVALRERALAEAGAARRAAAVTAVLSDIDRAMALGLPFPDAIAALRETADIEPPAILIEAAETGAPTREALQDSFAAAAHRAVAEALASNVGEEAGVGEVLARVQARFTGIPAEPTEGTAAPAVLSRARHALLQGRIAAALDEIATLPEPAQAAMADWTHGARLRDGADAALTTLRAEVGRGN